MSASARVLGSLPMFREFVQAFLGIVRDLFCARGKLIAENALLRQQVVVFKRSASRPRLKPRDRWTMAAITMIFPALLEAVAIVRPETVFGGIVRSGGCSGDIVPNDLSAARPSMRTPEP